MSSFAYLMGCTSTEDAIARATALFGGDDEVEPLPELSAPQLVGRYRIPLFWLAAFDGTDVLRFDRTDEEDGTTVSIALYRTETLPAVERLRARAPQVLEITGPAFAGFYGQWIDFVTQRYPDAILLQAEDILRLRDIEGSNRDLAAAIAAFDSDLDDKARRAKFHRIGALPFEPTRREVPSAEAAAEYCRHALSGSDWDDEGPAWPPAATDEEIASLASFAPGARSRPWWKFWG